MKLRPMFIRKLGEGLKLTRYFARRGYVNRLNTQNTPLRFLERLGFFSSKPLKERWNSWSFPEDQELDATGFGDEYVSKSGESTNSLTESANRVFGGEADDKALQTHSRNSELMKSGEVEELAKQVLGNQEYPADTEELPIQFVEENSLPSTASALPIEENSLQVQSADAKKALENQKLKASITEESQQRDRVNEIAPLMTSASQLQSSAQPSENIPALTDRNIAESPKQVSENNGEKENKVELRQDAVKSGQATAPSPNRLQAEAPLRRKALVEELPADKENRVTQRIQPVGRRKDQPSKLATDEATPAGSGGTEHELTALLPMSNIPMLRDEEFSDPIKQNYSQGEAFSNQSQMAANKSSEEDRSPDYWYARLLEAARREQNPAENRDEGSDTDKSVQRGRAFSRPSSLSSNLPISNQASRSSHSITPPVQLKPVAVSMPVRRFLKPLIGFDPADVSIHREDAGGQVTTEQKADAIAVNENIILKPDFNEDTPEQIGLLAHELVHVARRRQPRYAPPVVRAQLREDAAQVSSPAFPEIMDEESLARSVEGRIIRKARSVRKASTPNVGAQASRSMTFESRLSQPTAEKDWGGLPTPWDPLPEWVSNPSFRSATNDIGFESLPVATESGMRSGGNSGQTSATGAAIHFADADRRVPEPEPQSQSQEESPQSPQSSGNSQPGQDIDGLAQQVYIALKRRLAAERRREWFD